MSTDKGFLIRTKRKGKKTRVRSPQVIDTKNLISLAVKWYKWF